MKVSIEKKLGCTIEEFKAKLDAHMEEYKDCETEYRMLPDSLTYDELDYLGEYMDNLAVA